MLDLRTVPSPQGQVVLETTIGKGNFGYVYLGKLAATKEVTAVKVVQLKQEELREILLEVEILRDCSHQNVVRFMGTYLHKQDLWICMEYCAGGAVDSLYQKLPRMLTEDEVAVLIMESLKGLKYMHERHIIHRDIKSGNILLSMDGGVKLADFGVSAKTTAQTGYRAHSFIGTPYWMAPEVIKSEALPTHMYDTKADIWSLGIMAVELTDKAPPMSDIHPMRALYLIPDADMRVFMVRQPKRSSKQFIAFLQACIVKDPKQRPSAEQILQHPFFDRYHQMVASKESNRIMTELITDARAPRDRSKTHATNGKQQQKIAAAAAAADKDGESSADEDFDFDDAQPTNAEPSPRPPTKDWTPNDGGSNANVADAVQTADGNVQEDEQMGTAAVPAKTQQEGRLSFTTRTASALTEGIMGLFNPLRKVIASGEYDSKKDLVSTELGPDADRLLDVTEELVTPQRGSGALPYIPVALNINLQAEVYSADTVSLLGSFDGGAPQLLVFLLLGTDHGLLVADISKDISLPLDTTTPSPTYVYADGRSRVRTLVGRTRFRRVQVLEDYGVCMALVQKMGKSSVVRGYRLSSLKKLIRYVFGIKKTMTATRSTAASSTKKSTSTEGDAMNNSGKSSVPSSPMAMHMPPIVVPATASGYDSDDNDAALAPYAYTLEESPKGWARDFVKVLGTNDAFGFNITRTKTTIYMGVLYKASITVFEWAKLPYLRFMKVKEFWTPETPKFFALGHDGSRVRELIIGYKREANRVDFESSRVSDIVVTPELGDGQPKAVTKNDEYRRWQGWSQLTNATQTMDDDDGKPVAAPSWYSTLKAMKPSNSTPEPPPPRNFLVTYGAKSIVANVNGEPSPIGAAKTVVWSWASVVPDGQKKNDEAMEVTPPARVLPVEQDHVIGVHGNYIEVLASSGSVQQVLYTKASLKMLTPGDGCEVLDRRRGRLFVTLFGKKQKWTQFYWMRERAMDVTALEQKRRVRDNNDKDWKVFGTGAVVNKSSV